MPDADAPYSPSKALMWRGRSLAALLVLSIGVLAGWQAWQGRERDLAAAETLVASLARAAESQVDGAFRGIEFLLDEAAERIDPQAPLTPNEYEWFRARLTGLPEISALVIANAEGDVTGPTISRDPARAPQGKSSVADRDYFIEAKARFPAQKFLIGWPLPSRFSDRLSIPVVRTLTTPTGAFGGIIIAGYKPEALRDRLASVVIEDEGGAAVFRRDATILARVPGHERFVGKAFPNTPIFQDELPRRSSGVNRFVAPTDGNDKIIAFRALERYPLVVTVGLTKTTALADWRRSALLQGLALGALASALMAAALFYDRRAEAARRLTEELARSNATLEEQVDIRTAHLAAVNADLEHFAYAASHDLQEPLRNVTGFLQLLSRRYTGKLDQDADEFIAYAVKGAKQMSALITDILAYSGAGRLETELEVCDSTLLAHAARRALDSLIEEADAKVEIGALPDIRCYPVLAQSLFQNLIGNAVKYRDLARPADVVVKAVPAAEPGMIEFSVSDNGIGVEEAYLERIFGLFQRLHPRDAYEGTGIGLALCRKIVEKHGGQIWAESTLGQGTTIRFTLPSA